MRNFKLLIICFFITGTQFVNGQKIPADSVINANDLVAYLKKDVQKSLKVKGTVSQAALANYYREKFSERYFYDWKNFNQRFNDYNNIYVSSQISHQERSVDHISKYSDSTQWQLPFNYLNGAPVNAYALRHLARQHKMIDVAFEYYYSGEDVNYLNYFLNQMRSLNAALENDAYEKIENGNGVYEAFRSGYRVLNWMRIHNMFLSQKAYTDADQLTTIATLLQHGAHLYKNNLEFHAGNHQTRGLSALAMIAIMFQDFEGSDQWYEHAMRLLEEHLSKEINDDGFQFERSVHYHISDIENYYFVYQLAKKSNLRVDPIWEKKFKSLFITLTKIAYPDGSAPVLQDDTDTPWAEKNNISEALTLGYLIYKDPVMGYFATNKVKANLYWFLSESQLASLDGIETKKPDFKSLKFPFTGYYIMREGWHPKDNMMIVSAGLDKDKPDHQHGDMLGIQAMANGHVILPNYQVRYYLKDLELFKNSLVKNVALVDDQLQGKRYTSNKGGSGFGKFKELPLPETITWNNNQKLDLYIGKHNGFQNIDVNYSRQIIYLKDKFWVIKDNFKADSPHNYKQVWQGHYTHENAPNLLRSTFADGSGCDIFQLRSVDAFKEDGTRGKAWTVLSKNQKTDFSFISVIYPFTTFDKRIDEESKSKIGNWALNQSKWQTEGSDEISISNGDTSLFFSVRKLTLGDVEIEFSVLSDVYIDRTDNILTVQSISEHEFQSKVSSGKDQNSREKTVLIKPGDEFLYDLN